MQIKLKQINRSADKETQELELEINRIYRRLNKKSLTGEQRQLLIDQLNEKKAILFEKSKKDTNIVPVYNNNIVADHTAEQSKRLYNNKFLL